jgi:hypothetical protein
VIRLWCVVTAKAVSMQFDIRSDIKRRVAQPSIMPMNASQMQNSSRVDVACVTV